MLRIELVVIRGLGEQQIDMVRREVEAIWEAQEVTIAWSVDSTMPNVRVVIDRPAPARPAPDTAEDWHVAATRVIEGRVTPPIYVSLDVAERVVRAASPPSSAPALAGIMVPRVVGRAIAHELAHVLLNTRAHARRGLFRATLTADDFVSPARNAFTLDAELVVLARKHELLGTTPQ